jgi:FtsP/CotA-like multicopper oxidase with cupredoxin domain
MVNLIWQRRGRFTILATLLVAALLVFMGVRWTGQIQATSGGDPYSVPLVVDTNSDPDIVETTLIADETTVDLGLGVTAHAQTFNGQIPGPLFQLKVNDTVIVHFENHLATPSGVHWHGIELNNASDGHALSQNMVPPGGKFLYKFKVTRPGIFWYHPHHHSSTNQVFKGLYGPIVITDPNEATLIAGGVIPDASQTVLLAISDTTVCKAPGSNDARTFPASAPWAGGSPLPDQGTPPVSLCETGPLNEDGTAGSPFAEGDIPNLQRGGARTNEGQIVLTNGKQVGGRGGDPSSPGTLDAGAALYDVQAGQGLRLKIGNTSTIRFLRLRLTGTVGGVDGTNIPLFRIGGQGGLLDNAVEEGGVIAGFDTKYSPGEIMLDPGDRVDIVAAIPNTATGVLTLWTEDMERTGMGYANIPTVPVMHLNVTGVSGSSYIITAGTPLRAATGDPVPVLGAASGILLNPAAFVPAKPGMSAQDIQLRNGPNIDGVFGTHDVTGDYAAAPHMASSRYAELGDTLELTVTNISEAHHPFHLHGFSIQPLDLTDTQGGATPKPPGIGPSYTWPYHEFRDNVDVPGGYTLRFRVKLDDRPLMDGVTMGGGLGRWLFHCHIFFHSTLGMLSEFDVVDASGNERPYVNADEAEVEVDEGQTATMNGTYSDPDGDAVTLTGPSIGSFVDHGDGTWTWSYTTTDGPDETQILYVTATDAGGRKDQTAFQLKVNNLPPTVSVISPLNGALYAVNTNVTVTASITDPGSADTLSCGFSWDGGGPPSVAPGIAGTCSQSNTFTAAGVYTVSVTGFDDDGGVSAPATVMIVIYDPSAGFVTGGGTINSPPGAYVADASLTGKATFGFVSKYLKGKTIPTGETEFSFQTARFKFHSGSYEWLVVAGAKAQYRGTGEVNGVGNFGFLLTATDGQVSGGGGVDKFRIKIWDKSAGNAVVYDNVLGASEDIDVANPTAISSGSIVIHK